MRHSQRTSQLAYFLSAATLAAMATAKKSGFSLRDVVFFVELFFNWTDSHLSRATSGLTPTQVWRELERGTAEGLLRARGKKRVKRYTVTVGGVVELLRRLAEPRTIEQPHHVLFILFFLRHYGERVLVLLSEAPPGIKSEGTVLADPHQFIERQCRWIDNSIKSIDERIASNEAAARIARTTAHQGGDVITAVEKQFPYELNSVRPLSELLRSVPEQFRQWELIDGPEARARDIWSPSRRLLVALRAALTEKGSEQRTERRLERRL